MMPDIDALFIRELLNYDQETGILWWRQRDLNWFSTEKRRTAEHECHLWNARYAGKIAGTRMPAGYVSVSILKKRYLAHRIAWAYATGRWPSFHIDHMNGDVFDNRLANLREATRTENNKNRGIDSRNKSGFPGVTWFGQEGKWRARVIICGVEKHLGLFGSPEEAHAAYKKVASENGFSERHINGGIK